MAALEQIEEIVAFLRYRVPWLATRATPLDVAIVCGSGLSGLSEESAFFGAHTRAAAPHTRLTLQP
jgi:hypothetical protein